MSTTGPNPALEAYERLGGAYDVRVLEPSPPAVNVPPWFADDPVAGAETPAGRTVVSPVSTGDVLWDDLARDDADLALWCAERWLGAYRRLETLPAAFADTRTELHRLAERVISPRRQKANGKIGLRFTRGGFGTPFFGADAQVRVEGAELVEVEGGQEQRSTLEVDPGAAAALGDWYGFAFSVLEELRARSGLELEPSRVQIWPEHFDVATELGAEEAGQRANYGCSPGDESHPEPYLYVGPWSADVSGELWRATGFKGAEISYADLLGVEDQREAALSFFSLRLVDLSSSSPPPPARPSPRH